MTNPIQERPTFRDWMRRFSSARFRRLTAGLILGGIGAMVIGEMLESDAWWKVGIWSFLAAFVSAGLWRIAAALETAAAIAPQPDVPPNNALEQTRDG